MNGVYTNPDTKVRQYFSRIKPLIASAIVFIGHCLSAYLWSHHQKVKQLSGTIEFISSADMIRQIYPRNQQQQKTEMKWTKCKRECVNCKRAR